MKLLNLDIMAILFILIKMGLGVPENMFESGEGAISPVRIYLITSDSEYAYTLASQFAHDPHLGIKVMSLFWTSLGVGHNAPFRNGDASFVVGDIRTWGDIALFRVFCRKYPSIPMVAMFPVPSWRVGKRAVEILQSEYEIPCIIGYPEICMPLISKIIGDCLAYMTPSEQIDRGSFNSIAFPKTTRFNKSLSYCNTSQSRN